MYVTMVERHPRFEKTDVESDESKPEDEKEAQSDPSSEKNEE